jgi:hypothetical protein
VSAQNLRHVATPWKRLPPPDVWTGPGHPGNRYRPTPAAAPAGVAAPVNAPTSTDPAGTSTGTSAGGLPGQVTPLTPAPPSGPSALTLALAGGAVLLLVLFIVHRKGRRK